jgi:hypothetical protein
VVVGVKVSGRSDDEELIRTLVYGLSDLPPEISTSLNWSSLVI